VRRKDDAELPAEAQRWLLEVILDEMKRTGDEDFSESFAAALARLRQQ
jgi:hypothetical protein